MNFENARSYMIENQLKPNRITDPNILEIFNEIKKEEFLENDIKKIAYSDLDLSLIDNRGYLKNLHIAQLIQYSKIKSNDVVLHIGGLTGYVTSILARLSKKVYVIEFNKKLLNILRENLLSLNLTNTEILNNDFKIGYPEKSPYDLIFIDCPIKKINDNVLNQLNPNNGRLVMIERINEELCNGILITNKNNYFDKKILFDAFSQFHLYKDKEKFVF